MSEHSLPWLDGWRAHQIGVRHQGLFWDVCPYSVRTQRLSYLEWWKGYHARESEVAAFEHDLDKRILNDS